MVEEIFIQCLASKQVRILIQIIQLFLQIFATTHFFACIWMYIGGYHYAQRDQGVEGWIKDTQDKGIQNIDHMSLYCTSMYWVITTFSSVGYGDIFGHNSTENMFQILVELVGIAFFGYMTGTFSILIQDFKVRDQLAEQQESIDYWLMQLDRTHPNKALPPMLFRGVRDFFSQKYKYDCEVI